jgi:hypothetical protein
MICGIAGINVTLWKGDTGMPKATSPRREDQFLTLLCIPFLYLPRHGRFELNVAEIM